jgi:glycosyltransferase involved in cell wall biosynthesis
MKRILYITKAAPYPTNFGGGQRSNLILQALRELGEVHLILIGRPSFITDEHLQILRDEYGMIAHGVPTQAREKGLWPWIEKMIGLVTTKRLAHNVDGSRARLGRDHRLIQQLGKALNPEGYDFVFGRYAAALGNLGGIRNVPTLLDVDDLDSDVYESRINLAKNAFQRTVLRWHKCNIELGLKRIVADVDHTFVSNPSNRGFPGLENASVLPNIPFAKSDEVRPFVAPSPDSNTVMVIGSYDYEPNVQGVDWLVEKVWPAVHRRVPQAVLKIYGSNMADSMKSRWNAVVGVVAIGFADSLGQAYRDAAISVCPVLRGAGSNIKIIESAAHGRVCLLTQAAARGYKDDEELAALLPVAETAEAMAELIVHFLSHAAERDTMSAQLHRVAAERYSRRGFIDTVHRAVHSTVVEGSVDA